MGCLVRFVAAFLVLLVLAIAARRLAERETLIPPPGTGERDAVVDGVRWRSREASGTGDVTVVYVHGFLSSSTTWNCVLSSAAGGRRAIAVDLPGSGFSDRPWPYDYTAPAQTLHVWRYLDALRVGRVVLVGNSLGGAVCMIAAAARPERVAALVLVDAASPRMNIPLPFRAMRAPVVGELEMEFLCRPVMAFFLRHRVFAREEDVTERTISEWWDPIPVPGTRRAALAAIRSSPRGYEDVARGIKIRTLVLWGKEDRMVPLEEGAALAREIPGAGLVVIPGAGHVPQEETPDEFARTVRAFLAGAPTRSTGRSVPRPDS